VPESVAAVKTKEEAAARLGALNPAQEAVAEGIPAAIPGNGGSQVRILNYEGDFYRLHTEAAHDTLLRVAVPYFPGWRAAVDGRDQPVVPVDLALLGVVVPAGKHEVVVRFRSNWFLTGALVSALSWVLALGWLSWSFRGPSEPRLAGRPPA